MTSAAIEVHGACAAEFARVQQAFVENFELRGDVGASVAVAIGGELVVDLWGGYADRARTRPWERDTIATTYSTTKGMVALCVHMLVDRGELDWDAPVARYWPEFAQHGKGGVLVRHVMSHTAGLPAIREPLPADAIFDWERMISALASEQLWWEPGTTQGYHSVTYGFLAGEIVRQVSGRSIGTFFRDEVARPLGVDFHIGFGEELDGRVAEMIPAGEDPLRDLRQQPESLRAKVFHNPPAHNSDRAVPNTRAWRGAEIPSVNGHGNARALAVIYGALAAGGEAHGVRLLSPAAVARAAEVAIASKDVVSGIEMSRCLGFSRISAIVPAATDLAFGHSGQGGSLGFADPGRRLGFGYVPNQTLYVGDQRWVQLVEAVYRALA